MASDHLHAPQITFIILLLSLFLDGLVGDPPNRFHPTAWKETSIAFAYRFRPSGKYALEFLSGLLLTLGGMILAFVLGVGLEWSLSLMPLWAALGCFGATGSCAEADHFSARILAVIRRGVCGSGGAKITESAKAALMAPRQPGHIRA